MRDIKKLDANTLKIIAVVAMTIDHIAWAAFPGFSYDIIPLIMHVIGRITCPIMCYFVAEGYHHTKDINKYTARLFLFAVISHFAYMFNFNWYFSWKSFIPFYYGNFLSQTSVIWSFLCGLVMLRVANSTKIKHKWQKIALILLLCVISLPADWSCIASLCVLAFGTNRGKFKKQMFWMVFYVSLFSVVYFLALNKVYGIVQLCVALSIPLLMMYNGKRGKSPKVNKFMKWFFYIYYPLHLVAIGILKFII